MTAKTQFETQIDYTLRKATEHTEPRVIVTQYDGEGVPYFEPESDAEMARRMR